jgi:hypothetical protein
MNFRIYSPSYKRADLANSHNVFPTDIFSYVVRENEYELYKKKFPHIDIKIIKDKNVIDISTTRNWILNNTPEEHILMVDDDYQYFGIFKNKDKKRLSPDEIKKWLIYGFELASETKCGLWGVNLLTDPMAYRETHPFNFNMPVLGPFVGVLDKSLSYDETLPLKEDYDFFIQQMRKHRRALRINFLHYKVDHQKMDGGCQTYRTLEKEREQNKELVKKWGSKIIKNNSRNNESINMIVRVPL